MDLKPNKDLKIIGCKICNRNDDDEKCCLNLLEYDKVDDMKNVKIKPCGTLRDYIKGGKYIGSGMFGQVYQVGDDQVVKVENIEKKEQLPLNDIKEYVNDIL